MHACVYKFIKEFEDSPSLEPGTVRMPSERANHWASGSLRWKEIEKQGFSISCLKPLYIAHRRFCAFRRFSGGGGSTKNGGGGVSTKNGTRDGTIAAVVLYYVLA